MPWSVFLNGLLHLVIEQGKVVAADVEGGEMMDALCARFKILGLMLLWVPGFLGPIPREINSIT